jgi:hypothetical protein
MFLLHVFTASSSSSAHAISEANAQRENARNSTIPNMAVIEKAPAELIECD